MPQRAIGLLYALFGLLVVAGIVLVGLDVRAAAKRGPRWRRRFLGAGLALLGALGFVFHRPKPPVVPGCYVAMPIEVAVAYDLRQRLPLLENLAAGEKLDPEVVRTTLAAVEKELAELPENDETRELRARVRAAMERIRAKLGEEKPAPEVPLEETGEWKRILAAWKRPAEVRAAHAKTSKRITKEVRGEVLAVLAGADRDIGRLADAGQISAAEAGLLRADLAEVVGHVKSWYVPGDPPRPSCYEVVAWFEVGLSVDDLAERLPLLEKLAAAGKLQPAAVRKVLVSVEQDLATLSEEKRYGGMPAKERAKAEATREAVKAAVERIKARLEGKAPAPAQSLEESADWKTVCEAWREAMPLAESGKSSTRQRENAKKKLKEATEAATRLMKAGLLAPQEGGLLAAEARSIEKDIYKNAPTDSTVRCYEMMMIVPAKESLDRLAVRLPLVAKLAASGKVNPEAVKKVLSRMEKDLAVLGDEKEIAKLAAEKRDEAKYTRGQMNMALHMLKRVLEGKPAIPERMCYVPLPLEEREPESAIELDARLARVNALEASGKLALAAATRVRLAIEKARAEL